MNVRAKRRLWNVRAAPAAAKPLLSPERGTFTRRLGSAHQRLFQKHERLVSVGQMLKKILPTLNDLRCLDLSVHIAKLSKA